MNEFGNKPQAASQRTTKSQADVTPHAGSLTSGLSERRIWRVRKNVLPTQRNLPEEHNGCGLAMSVITRVLGERNATGLI